ncbi:hypothetical protein B6U91_01735 [Candidatus Pacearchaeota archaeon ex4484_71]|nr:MAG: hypothetical protein B6U91_01735 [Candidatus Pacearchaeota archaeon ex4484_71]
MRKIEFPTEDSSSPDYTVNVSLNGGVKRVYIQRVRSPSLTESLKSIFSKSKKEFAYSIEYAFN